MSDSVNDRSMEIRKSPKLVAAADLGGGLCELQLSGSLEDYPIYEQTSVPLSPQSCTEFNTSPHCFQNEPPIFSPVSHHYWGTTYNANDPCEDRFASIANILLKPSKEVMDEFPSSSNVEPLSNLSTNTPLKHKDLQALFRLSMFCVLDGHGGPFVAEYASKHLLPMLSTNIGLALDCSYVSMGEFRINNEVIPFKNNDGEDSILREFDIVDPWYTSPRDDCCCTYHSDLVMSSSTSPDEKTNEISSNGLSCNIEHIINRADKENNVDVSAESRSSNKQDVELEFPTASDLDSNHPVSSTKVINQSSKDRGNMNNIQQLIIKTIRETFLQFDELWMNGINIHKFRSTSCGSDVKCNAGSCCLVIILLQKSMYTSRGGKYVRCSSGTPILFSSHLGDCRAVLLNDQTNYHLTSFPSQENEVDVLLQDNNETAQSPHSDEDDSTKCSDDDGDMSSCSSNDSRAPCVDKEEHSLRNRIVPFKKRLLPDSRYISVPRRCTLPYPLQSIILTEDHTPYNAAEASLVRQRCKNAPNAIAPAISGGIKRVAGSLSVTRAFGDAYLKSAHTSFFPFKHYAPYITACPEISAREINSCDRFIILGSDGVWEKVDAATISKWVSKFFHYHTETIYDKPGEMDSTTNEKSPTVLKRKHGLLSPSNHRSRTKSLTKSNVSNVIAWKILNKVRRTRKMKNLKSLMAFPPGRARRLRHDDITACVIDLSGFIDFIDNNGGYYLWKNMDCPPETVNHPFHEKRRHLVERNL